MFSSCRFAHTVVALVCVFLLPCAGAEDSLKREIWKADGMTVTAIQDLPGEMSAAIFKGPASEKEKSRYFKQGKAKAGFNVFLLQSGGQTVLFDAGTGSLFQSPGRLPEVLASLGVKPEDVDFVLLSHLHTDHIGGLLREGARAFPKARLLISKPELESWLALAEKDPAQANAALVKTVVSAYGADVLPPFAFGDTLLPGVTALDASGHTPGHTVFQLTAGGKSLLIVGDLIHVTPLQFALPDEWATYDMDPPKAILARKRILALAEQKGIPIAGTHLPFPAEGMVRKNGRSWKFDSHQPD